jgi:hypothetical protein
MRDSFVEAGADPAEYDAAFAKAVADPSPNFIARSFGRRR